MRKLQHFKVTLRRHRLSSSLARTAAAVFFAGLSGFGCASTFTGPIRVAPTPTWTRSPATTSDRLVDKEGILVIGHRGASGLRPEHTFAAYDLAVEQGADFVEIDLVMTKDDHLILRHENNLAGTTNVADVFPDRKKTKTIDGKVIENDYFSEDFTLAEIKKLRAKQSNPLRDKSYDGQFEIPTFVEFLAWHKEKEATAGRLIGLYIELKHPTYHKSVDLQILPAFLGAMREAQMLETTDRIFVQCFEVGTLKELKKETKYSLVLLIDDFDTKVPDLANLDKPITYGDLMKPENLQSVREYASGIGPWKMYLSEKNGPFKEKVSDWIKAAHDVGLKIHPYTFRSEPKEMLAEAMGDVQREYLYFFQLGVDGVFSDFPADAFKAREVFLSGSAIPADSQFDESEE